jgi:DNA-binding transcriptional LysR family regulator
MKTDDLLLLAEVRRAGSLSAASRALDLPKATLSRRLSALEASAKARLFVPGARRLVLTELGEELAERAARHADDIAETRHWLASRDATPRGKLRVAMPADFGMLVLAEALARFSERYPEVELDIDTTPRLVDLFNEPYDLAVRIGHVGDPNLVARPLMVMEPGLFASPDYLARVKPPRTPADLGQHRFVILAQMLTYEPVMHRGKRRAGFELKGPVVTNSIGLTLAMARAGAGLSVFPKGMVMADLEAGRLVHLLPEWSFVSTPVNLVTVSRRLMPAKTRAFIDHLVESGPTWVHSGKQHA